MKDYICVLTAILFIYFIFNTSSVDSKQLGFEKNNPDICSSNSYMPQAPEDNESAIYQPKETKIKNGFIVLTSPNNYLDSQYANYTRSILGEAVFVYQQAKAENVPEKVALKKAVNLLKNADFTHGVTSSLLESVYSNEDSDQAKILKSFI